MRNRLLALMTGLALVLGCSTASRAQETPTAQVHAATGLSFPANIAGALMTRWNDYGQSAKQPGLGFSYHYQIPGRLAATVYVYDLNQRIPAGADHPVVVAQFEQAVGDIEKVAQQTGRYRDLRLISGPTTCAYGPVTFRCASYSAIATGQSQPVFTGLMVTGYRAHFVKLRLDWPQASGMSEADVNRFVQTLVGAILR